MTKSNDFSTRKKRAISGHTTTIIVKHLKHYEIKMSNNMALHVPFSESPFLLLSDVEVI